MNMIEKQTELGKSLYEINTSTMKSYMSMQRENFEKYVELNRAFGSRLPEIKNLSSAVELQREYGETLWNHTKSTFEAQNDLLKGAFGNTRDALKVAYTSEEAEEVVVAAPKKATAKKTAAKKVAAKKPAKKAA